MEHVLINYSKIYDWLMFFSLFVPALAHKNTQFLFFFHFNRIDEHEFRTRQIIDKNITTRWPILFMPLQWNIPVLRKSSIELIYSMGHLFSIRISFFIAMNKYPINFFLCSAAHYIANIEYMYGGTFYWFTSLAFRLPIVILVFIFGKWENFSGQRLD